MLRAVENGSRKFGKIISVPFIYLADNCSREAHRLGAPLFVCVWLDSLTNIKKKSNACKRKAPSVARESRMSLMSSRERRPFLSRAHTRTLTSVQLYAHDKKRRRRNIVPVNACCSAFSWPTYFLSNRKRSIAFIACCRIVADVMHSKGTVIIIARRCLP